MIRNESDANSMLDHAFQAHLAEYSALRDEINQQLGIQNNLVSYAVAILAGAASLFAIGDPSVADRNPFLLLVASILVSSITWALMDAGLHLTDLSKYMQSQLSPKLNKLLGERTALEFQVLKWDEMLTYGRPLRILLKGVAKGGKFLISFFSSVVLFVLFITKAESYETWTIAEKTLIWIALPMLIFPVFGVFYNVPYILGRAYNPYELKNRDKPRQEGVSPKSN